ncbi:MAG TPA: YdcF family protein [Anaerolineales bacterium]|nr:YdcF family protein [Anaerolineales bacterium]
MQKVIQRFWMIDDDPPSHPGCFVIPSYALKDSSRPTRPTRAQIELAFEWWKKFPQAKLIMSTGDNQGLGLPNSRVMAEYAVSLGLPRENVIEEDRSWNTHENLLYSMQIIQAQNLGQPTLVTLDLYTRRAVATARKMGWKDFHWLSAFSEGEPAYGYKWLQTHSRATIFCYEAGALIFSKMVGWV